MYFIFRVAGRALQIGMFLLAFESVSLNTVAFSSQEEFACIALTLFLSLLP